MSRVSYLFLHLYKEEAATIYDKPSIPKILTIFL